MVIFLVNIQIFHRIKTCNLYGYLLIFLNLNEKYIYIESYTDECICLKNAFLTLY